MKNVLLSLLLKLITSNATKTLIALGINELLKHKKDGITSEIAEVMIDGVAKSKMNPTKEDMFKDVLTLLKDK